MSYEYKSEKKKEVYFDTNPTYFNQYRAQNIRKLIFILLHEFITTMINNIKQLYFITTMKY